MNHSTGFKDLKEFIGNTKINHKIVINGIILSEVDNKLSIKRIFKLSLDEAVRCRELDEIEVSSSRYGILVDW